MIERLGADLGHDDAVAALEAMNEPPSVTTRSDGYVQDLASQWVVELVEAGPDDRVVDLCAAPGGKATAMARRRAAVMAADLQPHRVGLIADNTRRLGLRRGAARGGRRPEATGPPRRRPTGSCSTHPVRVSGCSGVGPTPAGGWTPTPRIDSPSSSVDLVDAAVPLVRPGGLFVYRVCTLTVAESTDIDRHLADHHPDLVPLDPPVGPWRRGAGARSCCPQTAGTDGMCMFRYRRPMTTGDHRRESRPRIPEELMSEGSYQYQAKVLTVSDGVAAGTVGRLRAVLGWSTGCGPRTSR